MAVKEVGRVGSALMDRLLHKVKDNEIMDCLMALSAKAQTPRKH